MSDVTIADLVRNGTMSAEMAALLWAAVDEKLSFLTVALPRLAGKSTTSEALLTLRDPSVAVTNVLGDAATLERLKQEQRGGYLVVNEFSRAPMPGYIWGEPVRRVFETLPYGYSLQTSLHASSVQEAIDVVTRGNGITDEAASTFKLVLYIERFGSGMADYWRRLVEIFELDRIESGRAVGRTLYRWQQQSDSFEKVANPVQFGRDAVDLEQRAGVIRDLAGRESVNAGDVAEALQQFRATMMKSG